MPRLINSEIMASPYNWATVLIMLTFGMILLALVAPQN